MATEIKYAVIPITDVWLFTQTCGDLAFQNMMAMDSFSFEEKHYLIRKRHYDMDDKSWIFLVEEAKGEL